MKIWKSPTAIAQEFVANDYISACYSVMCSTPHNNSKYTHVYEDSNKNGVLDDGDALVVDIKEMFGVDWFRGCNRRHVVEVRGELPTNNAFAVDAQGNNPTAPLFYWLGDVIGSTNPGSIYTDEFHSTDLTRSDAIIPADNPNHS